MTHYETLGVGKNASAEEIKRAYREKMQKAHPDKNQGGNHEEAVAIQQAFEVLSDPERRKRYDETGDDSAVPSIDVAARGVIVGLFRMCMDKVPESVDLIDLVRQQIAENHIHMRAEIVTASIRIAQLRRRQQRIKYKGAEKNFLDEAIETEIAKVEAKRNVIELSMRAGDRAIELLDEFEYEVERTPAPANGLSIAVVFTVTD
jgi:DnaJ-class molecular chaperone